MPDLGSILLRRSLRATRDDGHRCASCERTPLAGERLHELDGGRAVCDLCFAALPEESRHAVSSTRVSASERRLAVVPKAA